jgi:hypothetical protein
MLTSRLGVNGNYNVAYGIDGIFKVLGDDYFDVKFCQTSETGITNSNLSENLRISTRWERRSSRGLGYNLGYSQSGIHFNPGMGFEMMDDYASVRGGIKYGWMPGEKAKLYSHFPELRLLYMTYIDDRSLMSLNYTAAWNFQTKSLWQGNISVLYNKESLRDSLTLIDDELYIPPSQYEFFNFRGQLSTPGNNPFFIMMETNLGQFFDGNRFSINLQPTWNVSKHFELGGVYNIDKLDFSNRGQNFTNHIVGAKTTIMLDTKLSFNAFIQYNTAVNGVVTNLRLRYNPKEGNDFYIVFNEGRNTNLDREIPTLPVYEARSVLVKYTYTFSL